MMCDLRSAALAAFLSFCAAPAMAGLSPQDSLEAGLRLRPYNGKFSTQSVITGTVYQRTLSLERMRFRRDGDPLGGKGEIGLTWSVVPPSVSPLFLQSGSSGTYKVQHAKKKCDDDGCTEHGDGDCHWYDTNFATFSDYAVEDFFCNPLRVNFHFEEHEKNKSKTVGDFVTGGSVNDLISPAVVAGTSLTRCDAFDLVNTLATDKPAKIALRWNLDKKLFGTMVGRISCSDDAESCGEIDNYAYQHISGPEIRSLTLLKTVNLANTLFSGNRRFYIAYDTDNNSATGDPVFPFCGADYRVFVDLQYAGNAAPVITKRIEAWDSFTSSWGLTGLEPVTFKINGKEIEVIVLRSQIGNPATVVISWAAFEQNSVLAGLMPCLPCIERFPVMLGVDQDCARVIRVDDAQLKAGNAHAPLLVQFSEPMAPIAVANLAVSPALPLGTTLQVAQSDADRMLEVTAVPAWPPGDRQLTLLSGVTDQSGNALEDPHAPGTCGVTIPVQFCIEDSLLRITNAGGTPIDTSLVGQSVYLKGSGFPPNTLMHVYLLQQDGLDATGSALVDYSSDGPNDIVSTPSGELNLSSLGVPVAADEYGVIVDLNNDGLVDPGDRRTSACGVGLEVGPICDDGPGPALAHWSLDQKFGSVGGDRAAAHHMLVNGPALWVSGLVNGAFQFNGTSNWLELDQADELLPETGDFTISAWIKTSVDSGVVLAHRGPVGAGYILELTGGKPRFTLNDGTGTSVYLAASSPTCADSTWHLLTVTVKRDGNVAIYRDDTNVGGGSAVPRAGAIHNTAPALIGMLLGGTRKFKGLIDEVEIADDVYSDTDVATNFIRGKFGGCSEAVVGIPPAPTPPRSSLELAAPAIVPNPAAGRTAIHYSIPADGVVRIAAYDVAGRRVAILHDGFERAGGHQVPWELVGKDGRRLTSGMYFVRIHWNGQNATRGMIIAR